MAKVTANPGIVGVQKVMANLNKEIKKMGLRTMEGLIRGGIIIIRDTDKTPPKIPLDQGNLRASRFMITGTGENKQSTPNFKGKDAGKMKSDHSSVTGGIKAKVVGKPMVGLGFTANYAAAVEENKDPKEWKRPGSGRDFMKSSIKRNKAKILAVIAASGKIRT